MPTNMKIKCPVCHHTATEEFEVALNTRTQPELKKQLINGTLLQFECKHCGAKRHVTSNFLYHDPDKKLLFHVAPHYHEQREATHQQLTQLINSFPVSIEDYEMRIMPTMADLMEKVQIYDAGFSDYEIELVKLLTDGLFVKEHPTTEIKNRYFFINNDLKPKFIYITPDGQVMVDCHEKLLEFIRDKFKRPLAKTTTGQFTIINHAWAEHILQNKENNIEEQKKTDA